MLTTYFQSNGSCQQGEAEADGCQADRSALEREGEEDNKDNKEWAGEGAWGGKEWSGEQGKQFWEQKGFYGGACVCLSGAAGK